MKSEPGGEPPQRTKWQRFTQQRLRTWQPILAPSWIISIYNVSGLVFLCVGVGLLSASQSVTEYSHDYTDDADRSSGVGSFSIEIEQDMEPPIWIYYELDGFHQNHRRYVQSRDDEQLRDEAPRRRAAADLAQCKPWVAGEDGRPHYPCGLVARSVFNDTFALLVERSPESPGELLQVDSSAEAIAWSADARGRYRNVDPEAPAPEGLPGAQNQQALNMWILELFPPVTCEQTVISEARPFAPVVVARRNETLTDGRTVEVADCRGYASGAPSCNFVRDGAPFTCAGDYAEVARPRDWGVESGHFLVWMRTAGLPVFRKLWGKVDTALSAGSILHVHVKDNFEVKEFRGRKAFVISTTSMLGGRNDFLGYGYITVGTCCLIFGIAFLGKKTVLGSRPLGDLTLLVPGER